MYRRAKMKRKSHLAKPYLELTTAALLAQIAERGAPGGGLPQGSLVVIAPEGNAKVQSCLAKIARCYVAAGGAVFVQQMKTGGTQGC